MQTHTIETPRPRPPAKVRRSLVKGSSTPPPAYAHTLPFPTDTAGVDTPPMINNYSGWDAALSPVLPNPANPPLTNDLAWMDDKSREELTDLLVKADALIKERENELNLTSAACKTLHENNAALRNQHEALLTRLSPSPPSNDDPVSPTTSPLLPLSSKRYLHSLSRSASEFVIGASASPEPTLSKSNNRRPHLRGLAVSPVDFSFLADQNAELHSKLEKLETEATTADLAGRRELRRLEKEITTLKEELEKTQAKSEELEEKAKTGFGLGAEKVIEEAWKRKREREARINAVRKGTREQNEGPAVKNFAPEGLLLGSSTSSSHRHLDPLLGEQDSVFQDELAVIQDPKPAQQDQRLIAQLLQKMQELEMTNSRILEQQSETTSRLQAVQKETEFMTKLYGQFSASDDVDQTPEEAETRGQDPSRWAVQSDRALQSTLLATKVKRQRSFHRREAKIHARPSIMGLFDDSQMNANPSTFNKSPQLPVPFSDLPQHRSSYSISSSGLISPALSTLNFYSPPTRLIEDLSPKLSPGPSLANELGDKWHSGGASSLSDVGQLSAPPSPTSQEISDPNRDPRVEAVLTPKPILTNSLQLSIEPPTPQKGLQVTQQEHALIGNMSPRFRVAQTLRSRNVRWNDGHYPEYFGHGLVSEKRYAVDSSPTPSRIPPGGGLLIGAFEAMMDEFDGRNEPEKKATDVSRSPSPAMDQTDWKDGEEGHAVTVHSENEVTQSRFGSAMVEVWMWLQFIIIMLVFLWAMARRGPKSVLMNAERKRTLSMKRKA